MEFHPFIREGTAMKLSSLFATSLAVATVSIAPSLCGLGGTAMSQTTPTVTLPSVTVQAPTQVARRPRPTRSAVARAVSQRTSPTAPAASAAADSDSAKLARLAQVYSSCVDGCATSFKTGNSSWNGCNGSGWPALSSTCRNVYNFKSYQECREAGILMRWGVGDISWYCSSLAIKYAWAK
jgi:hypothetical protein